MFKLTKLITFRADADASQRQRLSQVLLEATHSNGLVSRARLQAAEPGAVNGGDLVWHVQFHDEDAYLACVRQTAWGDVVRALESEAIAQVDSAAYPPGTLGLREPGMRKGVHRILLLALCPHVAVEKIAQFEAEMREMPRYLPVIRNWNFSRISQGTGARRWTHVWEQEFEDISGLVGPYMMHPIHFGSIDRWFDTESQDWIVDPRLCHTVCAFEGSMLTPVDASS